MRTNLIKHAASLILVVLMAGIAIAQQVNGTISGRVLASASNFGALTETDDPCVFQFGIKILF